ncbi:MAG: helix-turn-helix transcriptional regulator [Geobacter sp.]|nr:MAG: helix-turn-helix transcriptional regulator [Geobacter sp.]
MSIIKSVTNASTSDRVKIIRKYNKLSQKDFAESLGIKQPTLSEIERGVYPPSDTVKRLIGNQYGVNSLWLENGEGPMFKGVLDGVRVERVEAQAEDRKSLQSLTYDDPGEAIARGYVQVPRYEIAASAGGGALVHSEQIVDHLAFKADWLKVSLGLSPKHVAVISVIGDSMEPYLDDGDLILVDLSVTHIENNAIYVLQFGDSLLVKRVQVKLDGEVIVKSDNPRYEPEAFHGDSAERLRVVGRMVRRLVR